MERAREKSIALTHRKEKEHAQRYRDRAMERRVLHNQPEHPAADDRASEVVNDRIVLNALQGNTSESITQQPEGIGNRLLKRMGWTEGLGLGTKGDGIAEPM